MKDRIRDSLPKILIPLTGLLALIWFLVRVIPKPTRASYPCMKAAAPMASAFVLWLIGLTGSVAFFRGLKNAFIEKRYAATVLFLMLFIFSGMVFMLNPARQTSGAVKFDQTVNDPFGEAKGIFPGRVVWVWDKDATNENCTNTYNGDGISTDEDDGWFLDKNNSQPNIDAMFSQCLLNLTEAENDSLAWNDIFTFFNFNKYGEEKAYKAGEKIFIKINATSSWGKGSDWGNITSDNNKKENDYYAVAETSPHVVLSLLRQLINIYGVEEEYIYVGDPMKHLYNHCYDKWHAQFPDVHYIAYEGGYGREEVIPGTSNPIHYSDNQTVLPMASDNIYTVLEEADYMINLPTLKAHARAGITLFPKNHFGSHTQDNAFNLHPGLVAPDEGPPVRTDYKMYRITTDLMGHERLGGNTVLFLLDALFAGSEAVDPPTKWDIPPFNGDWTSSLFASLDPVAIESVGYDFLRAEYDGTNGKVEYPNYPAVDDYIHQAASNEWWPDGITYDPDGSGTPMPCLGVHEHWNDFTNKEYTRDLGTGEGIELKKIFLNVVSVDDLPTNPEGYSLSQNYPNPFNPETTIRFEIAEEQNVSIKIYDILGKLVATALNKNLEAGSHQVTFDASALSSGTYIYRMTAGSFSESGKMLLLK